MKDNSIYRVTRDDYKAFLEQLKPECREIKTIDLHSKIITKVISTTTKECLCSRVSYNKENIPEQYFIFKMPLTEERRPPIPHAKIELHGTKQVQAFFDAYFKLMKEKEQENA